MRHVRARRAWARAAVAAALFACAATAEALQAPPAPMPGIAVGAGQTRLVWSAEGMIHTATRNADGTFGLEVPAFATYQSAPKVAIGRDGTEALLYQAGTSLVSRVQRPGEPGEVETLSSTAVPFQEHLQLAVDSTGRSVAAWLGTTEGTDSGPSALFTSTRPAGGRWSPAAMLVNSGQYFVNSGQYSMASDDAGDVVIAYYDFIDRSPVATRVAVWARALVAGATEWTAPVAISGADANAYSGPPSIAGGGARTFVVDWMSTNPSAPATRTARAARMRLPGSWEPPADVIPDSIPEDASADAVNTAIDGGGTAFALVRLPSLALGVTTLPATQATWTPEVTLDPTGPRSSSDSAPAIAFGDDGSATVAFVRSGAGGGSLRIFESPGPPGEWHGQGTDVTTLGTCSIPAQCALEWRVAPLLARSGPAETVVVQTYSGVVFALARSAPGAAWVRSTLQGSGSTRAYLDGAKVREGHVRAVAECRLPPCQGVVVLKTADGTHRVLGSIPVSVTSGSPSGRSVRLPRWAQMRLARGALTVRLTLDMTLADGSKVRTALKIRLHR